MRSLRQLPTLLALAALASCGPAPNARKAPASPAPAPHAASAPAPAPPPPPAPIKPKLPPPARAFTEFLPSRHGFHFTNSFSGSPLPFSLGGLEKHLSLPSHYGLCGGMSFAAADFFLANLERPLVSSPPEKGDALYDYIYSRQVASLGDTFAAVPKFAAWMALPDEHPFGPRFLTIPELALITERLHAGHPALLGLVLTSTASRGALWENHQVLAYAVAEQSPRSTTLRIYDPNYPDNDDVTLALTVTINGRMPVAAITDPTGIRLLTTSAPALSVVRRAAKRRDTQVRGVFLMPYSPSPPPPELSGR